MSHAAEDSFIREKTNYEAPLRMNEQIYYNRYVEGAAVKEQSDSLGKYKEELREKRQESRQMLDMQEFQGLHGDVKLRGDMKKLAYLRDKEGQKYKTQRAEIFETIIKNSAELSDWFDGAYVSETVEFDDRTKHTDFVLEWESDEEDDEPTRLAIDVTVAENPETLKKKADFITRDLRSGKLTEIDYFESEIDGEQQALKKIPRVVLALKQDSLEDLCDVALSDEKGRNLAQDGAQLIIIMLAIKQLKKQLEFIKSKGLKNENILEKTLDKMTEVYNNKKSSLDSDSIKRAE